MNDSQHRPHNPKRYRHNHQDIDWNPRPKKKRKPDPYENLPKYLVENERAHGFPAER